ncbi:MAG: hypothetical protein PHH26_00685 [Candidatus Thermoplasmatota archaeon]|nr:hypothetical protein [Candidatus Thermoplasmatota archaeon]
MRNHKIKIAGVLILLLAGTCGAVDPNLIARWTMDNLKANSVPTCAVIGTIKPDVVGTYTAGDIYNGNRSWSASVCGWQIINATTPTLPTDGNYSTGNPIYDSANEIWWWPISDVDSGLIYIYSASDPTDTWTLATGIVAAGSRPQLVKYDSTWYLYYHTTDTIDVRTVATEPNKTWSAATTILEKGAADTWDDTAVGEPFVIKSGSTYYLFYMGNNGVIGAVDTYEKVGYATSSSPTGPFTKYAGNPLMSGGTTTTTTADNGNVRAADPALFQLAGNTTRWYISVATTASLYGPVTTCYFYTDNFTTVTELSTLNPLLNVGAVIDDAGTWRAGPPFTYDGITYIPYQGKDEDTIPVYTGKLATLTIDAPTWYIWWSDPNWIISPALGVKSPRHWYLNNTSPFGNYTASTSGTATGTLALTASTIPDEMGTYNGTYQSGTTAINTPDGAVTGKINGGLDLDLANTESVSVGNPPGVKSITAWIKPDNLTGTKRIFQLTTANSFQLVGATLGRNGLTAGSPTVVYYVDGQVTATVPNDGQWHHVVITLTAAFTCSTARIGGNVNRFDGMIDDVRLYNDVLTPAEVNLLFRGSLPAIMYNYRQRR